MLASEETDEARAQARDASARFEKADYEGAAEAYRAAIETLTPLYEEEEKTQAAEIAHIEDVRATNAKGLALQIRGHLRRLDQMGRRIAMDEVGLARCEAHLGHLEASCQAVARALGYDLGLLEGVRADEHLAAIREQADWQDLLFRLTKGRAHFDTGDALEWAYYDRAHRGRLRLGPGDPHLATLSPAALAIGRLAVHRVGRAVPDALTFNAFVMTVHLAVLDRERYGGWPYKHPHIRRGGPEIEKISEVCSKRFEQRQDETDGPFWAFAATCPAAYTGKIAHVREILAYLETRSPMLYKWAIHDLRGAFWYHPTLPGASTAASRDLEQEVDRLSLDNVFEATRLMAWMGDPRSMNLLGRYFQDGLHGLPKNPDRALRWFEGSAALGFPTASINLADCYARGLGVEKDPDRGLQILRAVAKTGDPTALNLLGYWYQYGIGAKRDYVKARALFRQATEQGHVTACESLGILLHRAQGGVQDYVQARRWYEEARDGGSTRGWRRLGGLTFDARKTDADLDQAVGELTKALAEVPGDRTALLYLWASQRLRGDAEAAREAAAAFLVTSKTEGAPRAFVEALTHDKFPTAQVLEQAMKEEDDATRKLVVGQLHFVAGIQALVEGHAAKAREHFEHCVELGDETDSIRFTAMAELKRLDEA